MLFIKIFFYTGVRTWKCFAGRIICARSSCIIVCKLNHRYSYRYVHLFFLQILRFFYLHSTWWSLRFQKSFFFLRRHKLIYLRQKVINQKNEFSTQKKILGFFRWLSDTCHSKNRLQLFCKLSCWGIVGIEVEDDGRFMWDQARFVWNESRLVAVFQIVWEEILICFQILAGNLV